MSVTLESAVFMGKNHSDNQHSIKNTDDLTMKQMFEYLRSWYPNNQMRFLEWKQLIGKTLHGSICLWLWWTSHQSLAHKGLRILRFCVMPWKDEREPSINYCMGRQIDVVQTFTRNFQSFGQKWWWANGIRVEDFPRIHNFAALPQSPRVTVKIECNTRENLLDGSSSCRCSTTSHGDLRTTRKNASQMLNSSLSMQRGFGAGQWSFFGPGSEKKWYSISEDGPQGEWDKNCWADDVKNSAMERGDQLWKDSLIHCSCQVCSRQTYLWLMTVHTKNFYCKIFENELKSYRNKTEWANCVRMQDSWPQLKSDSISWRKTLFSQFTDSVGCREYTLPKDESLSEPKGWIRGSTKIGPVLEVTTCCLQGKYGVEIRIEPVNKDISFSLVDQNFSWIE